MKYWIDKIKYGFESLLDLLYPRLCLSCAARVETSEDILCLSCRSLTIPTDQHLHEDNEFVRHFKGRVPLSAGAALYYYVSGGVISGIVGQIKYRGRKDLAYKLGIYYGEMLRKASLFHGAELIIPVPLHPLREKKRGYNQSLEFAKGLAESMSLTVEEDVIVRKRHTETQTARDRNHRAQNMQDAFVLARPEKIENRHLLLVDDVLTTGATLDGCATALLQGRPASLRMATIAMGH